MIGTYLTKERLISYYNQAEVIKSLGKKVHSILEIGIYNSLFTDILRKSGYEVTTGDINPELKPNLIIDLTTDFVIPPNQFDAIVLFQVLEHIPYEKFEIALIRLKEATQKYLVISLPYYSTFFSIRLKYNTPGRPRHLLWQIPNFWKKVPLCEQHSWEIGLKGYPKKRITDSIEKAGLKIKREYQDPLNPYHYFFILEKS